MTAGGELDGGGKRGRRCPEAAAAGGELGSGTGCELGGGGRRARQPRQKRGRRRAGRGKLVSKFCCVAFCGDRRRNLVDT
uniref:Uncharacterized protein n=1 Tax=Oryza nivara TaxID=4536 RepID=A0A0E0ITH3_ORYNI